jgi:NADPH-dependent glutamate synthase beta subunit-like oxidoreductase/ferredoxin
MDHDDRKASGRITPAYRPAQVEKRPPCQEGCANCGDIRGWIGTVAQRDKTGLSREEAYSKAWRIITEVNPFPSVLGRICPHPCEEHCNRSGLDEPLAINAMERFLGDWAIRENLPLERLDSQTPREWIGVIGAGPSGLSFAYQMARRGYRVTVYEARSEAGGMLRFGVPDYRLPPDVLESEIRRILDLGVELKLDNKVGRDLSLEELRERHAALYLGLGAQQGRRLGIPGEEGASVWTGTDFLLRVNCGEPVDLGDRVVVIGGGNTAIDAARSARRTGAEVAILYRRSRAEMPASKEEIEEALEEGIELQFLVAPLAVERAGDGALEGLLACRMELGEPDASGRRRPLEVPGSEFRVAADSVIAAVAQAPVLDGFETLDHEGDWLVTDRQGVVGDKLLAGGDALAPGIAGNAIVQGRHAAEKLHARLSAGRNAEPALDQRRSIGPERIRFEQKPGSAATVKPKLDGAERVARGTEEIASAISEEDFLREVERCYSCGSCMGCEQCAMYCTAGCFTRLEEPRPGFYYTLKLDACEECGKCIEVCPCGYLEVS